MGLIINIVLLFLGFHGPSHGWRRGIINIVLLFSGAVWCLTSVIKFDFWNGTSTGAGFLPIITSALMVVLTLPGLAGELRKAKEDKSYFKESFGKLKKREFIPVAVVSGVLLASYVLGLMSAMTIMVFGWLKWISGYKAGKSLFVTVLVMSVICGVFKIWLQLPFPKGLLGI